MPLDVIKLVAGLKDTHRHTWRNQSEQRWLHGLLEETYELSGALIGKHAGPVEFELLQIAAICLNWIEMRDPETLTSEEQSGFPVELQIRDTECFLPDKFVGACYEPENKRMRLHYFHKGKEHLEFYQDGFWTRGVTTDARVVVSGLLQGGN